MQKLSILAALVIGATAAQAGDFYGAAGVPGVIVGYSHPVSERFALRADLATLGHHNKRKTEQGIDYDARLKADRLGVFGDWFPTAGGWRLTGGVTGNDARLDMTGRGNGGTITIGANTYVAGPDDRFDVTIEYPSTMPYLGFGYGGAPAAAKGWSMRFDLGVLIGKPRVSGRVSGPLLTSTVAQSDVDRELNELRTTVDDVKVLPQLSLGVNYRF